jgi:LmbE family N-acetylglucosaminyl deacetylase
MGWNGLCDRIGGIPGGFSTKSKAAQDLLRRLRSDRNQIDMPVLIVLAHPDDETISCGALLRRFAHASIVLVTDGAPHSMTDAHRLGFPSREAYAAARSAEFQSALAIAGVPPGRIMSFGVPDQGAAFALQMLVNCLEPLLLQVPVVLTHAFEGGHPDHDAVSFAVHTACTRIRRTRPAPDIVEMPFYRAFGNEWVLQDFVPDDGTLGVCIDLCRDERQVKSQMIAAHVTQRDLLTRFRQDRESFRIAPDYDFKRLPNDGSLLYERYDWGMNARTWLDLATGARVELVDQAVI